MKVREAFVRHIGFVMSWEVYQKQLLIENNLNFVMCSPILHNEMSIVEQLKFLLPVVAQDVGSQSYTLTERDGRLYIKKCWKTIERKI